MRQLLASLRNLEMRAPHLRDQTQPIITALLREDPYAFISALQSRIARLERQIADLPPQVFEKEFQRAVALSAVDAEIAKIMTENGDGNVDKVSVSKKSMSAGKLKPSQTTMVLDKSLDIALSLLESGEISELGAIISKDGYIMDGHHRWTAAILAGGADVKVIGYVADLKGAHLVRALNILTKGHFGVQKGNAGEGALSDYTPSKVAKGIRKILQTGTTGKFAKTPKEVENILIEAFGSVHKGIEAISQNARAITRTTPSWAPDRSDMPVIKRHKTPEAIQKLQEGAILLPFRH